MHTLMRDKLIDAERDVYSVSHVGLYDNAYIDVDGWLNSAGNTDLKINDEIRQGPDSFATNPPAYTPPHRSKPRLSPGYAVRSPQ